MTIVLDCNIWVSVTINSQLDTIIDVMDRNIIIATCSTLRNEIADVLSRPKLSKFIPQGYLQKTIDLHDLTTVSFELNQIVKVVSDEKDNYLFALCLASKADYLVTGDKLLLSVHEYHQTKLLSLADLKRLIK